MGGMSVQYLGVPFAAPPVGDRRWRPPANASTWVGVRNSTYARPICIQAGRAPVAGQTDEDCLYLDVFMPRTPPPSPSGYPVMIWLHGGSFATGSAQNASSFVELSRQLTRPVVWVGVNYRLNVFGFLGGAALASRDPDGSFGNYGLQDQRAAMRFVKANIASFGGDASRVTIDGCSAGAGSVANHITNRRSWPYFHQAAAHSGMMAAWNSKPLNASQQLYGLVAQHSGCPSGEAPAAVGCTVHNRTAAQIVAAAAAYAADKVPKPRAFPSAYPQRYRPTPPCAHGTPHISRYIYLVVMCASHLTGRVSCGALKDSFGWGPVEDGVEVLGPPNSLARQGHLFGGPLLLGTAKDGERGVSSPTAVCKTDRYTL